MLGGIVDGESRYSWDLDASAEFSFTGVPAGTVDVYAGTPPHENSTVADYTVVSGAGTFVFTVDQKATSGELQLLGSVPSDGSPITVTVSQNDDSGVLRADAVRLDADGWRSSGLGGLFAAGPVWAEYNFSLANAGTHEVLVSTPGHSNSTSSAVYTITNNGSVIDTFTTSQKSSTDGFETLGYVEAVAGDLTVRVTNGGSGYLRTDQLQIRDVNGFYSSNISGAYQGDSRYSRGSAAAATYMFDGLSVGTYDLLVNTPGHANSTTSAVYSAFVEGLPAESYTISQRESTGGWVRLGTIEITEEMLTSSTGTVDVELTNGAPSSGLLRTDAVRLEIPGWNDSNQGGYNNDSRWTSGGTATYTFTDEDFTPGESYQLYVNTPGHENSTAAATYEIQHGDEVLSTYTASQKSDTNEQPDNLAGWLPLGDPIIVPEDATELTIAVSKPEADEDLLRTDAVALGLAAAVKEVVFRQEAGPGYGELDEENPDGTLLTPEFQGGFRLFPGAQSAAAPDQANNVVRVRAILKGMTDDDIGMTKVLFRSFDVDDPSDDATIDPNGAAANDNRGRLMNVPFGQDGAAHGGLPAASADGSPFSGYLRPIKEDGTAGAWQALVEGRTEAEAVVRKAGDTYFAEVDLATSYAPGDNFRVAAVIGDDNYDDLRAADADDVFTSPEPDLEVFPLTDQLSVWRYVHIEQDHMASTASPGWQAATITHATAPADDKVVLTLNSPIIETNQYQEGHLRTGGKNYDVVSNDEGTKWSVDIAEVAQAGEFEYTLTLDFGILPDPLDIPAGHWEFGKLVVLDDNFKPTELTFTIISHVDGEFDQFIDVQVLSVEEPPIGRVHLFEPDAKITVTSSDEIAPGGATLYDDDFKVPDDDGHGTPFQIVDTANVGRNAALYKFVEDSTVRHINRFADAYVAPRLDTLDQFDSVIPSDPAISNTEEVVSLHANHAGSAGIRNELFWAVYVASAYEPGTTTDNDSDDEASTRGDTVSGVDDAGNEVAISVVYLETIRDHAVDALVGIWTGPDYSAAVTTHEIGHQFSLSSVGENQHADDGFDPNLMSSGAKIVFDFQLYFLSEDILAIRKRILSPGRF